MFFFFMMVIALVIVVILVNTVVVFISFIVIVVLFVVVAVGFLSLCEQTQSRNYNIFVLYDSCLSVSGYILTAQGLLSA